MNFGKYQKAIVAAAGAVIVALLVLFGADSKYYELAVAIATALGVYAIPNKGA